MAFIPSTRSVQPLKYVRASNDLQHNHKTFIIGKCVGFFRWPDVETAIKEVP